MKLNIKGLEEKQKLALAELADQLGFGLCGDGTEVTVSHSDSVSVTKKGDGYFVTYTRECELFRALSELAGVISGGEGKSYTGNFGMLCYMADMSRNAVYNMASAKRMIRYLALMGYDSLMLYTEDTYELRDYPYFGHMRGRFSEEELREIDDYADLFGIEVIPCIQTLAHLATALRWSAMGKLRDTGDILLVGSEDTYTFIDACLKTCKRVFRSGRINIGMDEAHSLGLGRYLGKNGYRPATEIMLEHLDRVVKLCHDNGYSPMIWSDMFFRMAFGGAYRVREGEISSEVIAKVPDGLTLVYWDYYSMDEQIFSHMVDCHLKFKNPVVFAGGAWKWSGFAPHNRLSLRSTEMQLDVCERYGLDNVIVTGWGDDGGEASQFSILPTMLYFAERAYMKGHPDGATLEKRSRECFGIGYEELLTFDAPNELTGITAALGSPKNPCRYLLYNDPLEGLFDLHMDRERVSEDFMKSAQRLLLLGDDENFGYAFTTLGELCLLLSYKATLGLDLRDAYRDGDRVGLAYIAQSRIPDIVEQLDVFIEAFRTQWYFENRTFGFSVEELRLGGLKERLLSTASRVQGYLDGEYERIEELEQPLLSFDGKTAKQLAEMPYVCHQNWKTNSSVGVF